MAKVRADLLMVEQNLAESRESARRLIMAGRVRLGTLTLVKPATMLEPGAALEVTEPDRYVSRGGLKLQGALEAFNVSPEGRACMDLGASTGGFTDCLLQHGAVSVLAVDVGRAQLHSRLRDDPRVTLLEGTNARDLPELPPISLFVADLSFISLQKVLPSVAQRVPPSTEGIVLLKPQFEAGAAAIPRGGVIKDSATHERVRTEFVEWAESEGWEVCGIIASPIRGGDGNLEYLVHIVSPKATAAC